MSEIHWIKLRTEMFDDEKIQIIQSQPEIGDSLIVIWIRLLVLAGKVNSNGFIFISEDIPYSPENLAIVFRKPIQIINIALKTFSDLRMIEIDQRNVIKITNWGKHQSIEGMDRIRELTRLRVEKHRKTLTSGNVSSNVTVTQSNATEIDPDKDLEKNKEECITITLQDRIRNLWIRTFGRNPKQPEFEETERLLQKYGYDKIFETFKKAALRNIKSLQYLLDNVDPDFNLISYNEKNNKTESAAIPAAHQYL